MGRGLGTLTDKRIVAGEHPLSTKPSRETRYRVADPHLRLWLAHVGPYLPEIERGRGDRVVERLRRAWPSWRGRAVEPIVREALARLPENELPPGCQVFGGYWTRTNDPEIDLVAADREPVAKHVAAVGSIKWLENSPFDGRDLSRLLVHRTQLPGATDDTPPLVVSRSGVSLPGLPYVYDPARLLGAWE
ncbi:DUF234 domain-containing protein [Yinghuangia soli]|uniref:DUF234 domain-containing protein n=1 Tax=Yinghuangia soli TaxID=2908204 RepID=A0AA41PYT0_9ACTN|nr:DUF234 domain-containing protein [Yinghuangia soli]MCF2528067.1 DUF234 domain-containing protein [Yinghuangia soli]